jgi:hypothetical protein
MAALDTKSGNAERAVNTRALDVHCRNAECVLNEHEYNTTSAARGASRSDAAATSMSLTDQGNRGATVRGEVSRAG